jgi:hypothetical protein
MAPDSGFDTVKSATGVAQLSESRDPWWEGVTKPSW